MGEHSDRFWFVVNKIHMNSRSGRMKRHPAPRLSLTFHNLILLLLAVLLLLSAFPALATTSNLQDFLNDKENSVIITGANEVKDEDTGETYYQVTKGKEYRIDLVFQEERMNPNIQFDVDSELTYQIPAGITAAQKSGTMEVPIETSEGTFYPKASYNIDENGKLTIKFINDDEDVFTKLKAATNVFIDFYFQGVFNGSETEIKFSNEVEKNIVFEDGKVDVKKEGTFNKETGQIDYVLTITANGNCENIVITDELKGEGFRDITIPKISGGTPNSSTVETKKFEYVFDSMDDGDTITIAYSANLDFSKFPNGSLDYEKTTNSYTYEPSGENEPQKGETHHYDSFNWTGKKLESAEETEDDKKILNWKITYNELALFFEAGYKIVDAIDESSREYMSYYGTGITVYVYGKPDADGNKGELVEIRDIDFEKLTYYDENSTWTYTIPDDEAYSYEITYQTAVDMEKVNLYGNSVYVSNTAQGTNTSGSTGGTSIGPEGGEINITKRVESTSISGNIAEITWLSTITIPAGGLSSAVVTDTLPIANGHDENYNYFNLSDLYKDNSLIIKGLLEGESWEVNTDDPSKVVVTFYQDGLPGLMANPDGTPRDITIQLTTSVDPDWLKYGFEGTFPNNHDNKISLNGKEATATAYFEETRLLKNKKASDGSSYDPTINDDDTILTYTLVLEGVDSPSIKITDTFDTKYFELYTDEDSGDWLNWYNLKIFEGDEWGYGYNGIPVTATPSESGIVITTDSVPLNNGNYYSHYYVFYRIKLKDGLTDSNGKAITTLEELAMANGGIYKVKNTATWNGNSDDSEFEKKYDGLEKEVTQEASKESRDVKYKIVYNPEMIFLHGGTKVILTDALNQYLSLDYTSITITTENAEGESPKVTYSSRGISAADVADNGYDDDYLNGTLVEYVVPDGTKVTIEYSARVVGTGKVINYKNTAESGFFKVKSEKSVDYSTGGEGGGSLISLTVSKADAVDESTKLAGVKFYLYPDPDIVEELPSGLNDKDTRTDDTIVNVDNNKAIVTVNADGIIKIDEEQFALFPNYRYYIEEITDPTVYDPNWESPDTYVCHDSCAYGCRGGYPCGYPYGYAQPDKYQFTLVEDQAEVDYSSGVWKYYVRDFMHIKNNPRLIIEKEVVSTDQADLQKTFTFQITALKDDGESTYTSISNDTFKDGMATFELSNGMKIGIIDLPSGQKYKIEEIGTTDGSGSFSTKILDWQDKEVATGKVYTGTVGSGTSYDTWTFVNTSVDSKGSMQLSVEKGMETWPSGTDSFTFKIEAGKDADDNEDEASAKKIEVLGDTATVTIKRTDVNPDESPWTALFDKINFTKDDLGKTFTFVIREVPPCETKNDDDDTICDGVKYDNSKITVTVTLALNANDPAKIVPTVTVKGDTADNIVDSDDDGVYLAGTFTNSYEAEGSGELKVTKTLDGREWKPGDTFTFTVMADEDNPTPAMPKESSVEITNATEDHTVSFGTITFTKVGTYKYTVTENAGSIGGVSYDTEKHTVTFVVEDDGKGTLAVNSASNTTQTIEIENTFSQVGTATITVNKEIKGTDIWPEDGVVTFKLEAVTKGAPMPDSDTITLDSAGEKSFKTIQYEKPGEYKYTITESSNFGDGWTKSPTDPITVTVTVGEPDAEGVLQTKVTYDPKNATITNTYEAEGKLSIYVTKEMTNWPDDKSFTFILAASEDDDNCKSTDAADDCKTAADKIANIDKEKTIKKTDESYQAIFGSFEFDLSDDGKTYKYTITEAVPTGAVEVEGSDYQYFLDGITYTNKPIEVTISLSDDGKGNIIPTVNESNVDSTSAPVKVGSFTNSYEAKGELSIYVTKEMTNWPDDKSFTFILAASEDDDNCKSADAADDCKTAADKISNIDKEKTIKKSDESYQAVFGSFKFDMSDDGKTYKYVITENVPTGAKPVEGVDYQYILDGITYTNKPIEVIISLSDDGKGNIVPTVNESKVDDTSEPVKVGSFTNSYEAEGEAIIKVAKAISGAVWPGDKKVVFTISADEGVPMPKDENGVTKTNVELGAVGTATFETITYSLNDAGKTYTYTIEETTGFGAGWTPSGKVTVKVTVGEDKGDGTLRESTYKYDPEDATITNTYESSGVAELKVRKAVNNANWPSNGSTNGSVTFTLSSSDEDAPMPDETGRTVTVQSEDEIGVFGKIRFDQDHMGPYTYTIEETAASGFGDSWKPDKESFKVTVNIEDNGDGTLTVTYDPAQENTVTNTYAPTGTATIEVNKAVEGADWPSGGEVTFKLEPVTANAPMPSSDTIKLDESSNGNGSFEPIDLNLTHATVGTYQYKITETDNFGDGWSTKNDTINVTITVTEDRTAGTITASIDYDPVTAAITNTYEASGVAELKVRKAVEKAEWPEDAYVIFTLSNSDKDAPMPVKNKVKVRSDSETGVFGTIIFDQDHLGEYVYTIMETDKSGFGDSWTTDPESIEVTVKVEDNKDGTLTITYDPNQENTVTNTYTARGEAEIKVRKRLSGTNAVWPENGKVTFTLEANGGGPLPENKTIEIDKAGEFSFDKITYGLEHAGQTYNYTITESASDFSDDWFVYPASIAVKVEVGADTGTGELKTTVTYSPDHFTFINSSEEIEEIELTGTWVAETPQATTTTPNSPSGGDHEFHLVETGFSAIHPQVLAEQPKDIRYKPLHWTLEIPTISLLTDIVEVPAMAGAYPVTWLGADAGLLEGTSIPGEGKSIIAGHNHLNTTEAGPFAFISWLNIGDRIFVLDSNDKVQIFVVYANEKIHEDDFDGLNLISGAYQKSLTLITCEDERITGGYENRRIIAARPITE